MKKSLIIFTGMILTYSQTYSQCDSVFSTEFLQLCDKASQKLKVEKDTLYFLGQKEFNQDTTSISCQTIFNGYIVIMAKPIYFFDSSKIEYWYAFYLNSMRTSKRKISVDLLIIYNPFFHGDKSAEKKMTITVKR